MISDDELLLYYYRDGLDASERARIGAALSAQPELAQRLHALVAKLDAVAAMPEVPVPARIQQRWIAALEREAGSEVKARPVAPRSRLSWHWQAAAASVAAVALAFTVQQVLQQTPGQSVEPPTAAAPNATDQEASPYENGLKWHLASTERQIASLGEATPEERAKLVDTIIGQNRIYALAAERAGEPQLARVLRAFTPILEDVASGRASSTDGNLAQLSFELRVTQARLSAARTPTSL
jgi:hypothetical protein